MCKCFVLGILLLGRGFIMIVELDKTEFSKCRKLLNEQGQIEAIAVVENITVAVAEYIGFRNEFNYVGYRIIL